MLPIPSSFAELTPDWLTVALREAGHLGEGRVSATTTERLGEGSGFMSQVERLLVEYDAAPAGLPASFIVKMAAEPGPNREMGVTYRIYEKESRFYAELAPRVSLRTPKPYVNLFDPASHDFVLLLEDLAPMQVGSELVTPTDDQVRLAVTEMARFHAAWWDPDGTRIPAWVPRLDEPPWTSHKQFWEFGWPLFKEQRGHTVPAEMLACGDRLVDSVLELQALLCRPPLTIFHMDWRLANLLFDPGADAEPFAVIDWQPFSRGRGAYDLGYFLSQSIPADQRRRLEGELLAAYLDTLLAQGVSGYDHDTLLYDYRLGIAYTLLYPMGTVTIDLANADGQAYAAAIAERAGAAVVDHDILAVIP